MHKTERINAAKAEAEAILVVASATAASITSACGRMLTYADVCRRMRTYAEYQDGSGRDAAARRHGRSATAGATHVLARLQQHMLTYADVC